METGKECASFRKKKKTKILNENIVQRSEKRNNCSSDKYFKGLTEAPKKGVRVETSAKVK